MIVATITAPSDMISMRVDLDQRTLAFLGDGSVKPSARA